MSPLDGHGVSVSALTYPPGNDDESRRVFQKSVDVTANVSDEHLVAMIARAATPWGATLRSLRGSGAIQPLGDLREDSISEVLTLTAGLLVWQLLQLLNYVADI